MLKERLNVASIPYTCIAVSTRKGVVFEENRVYAPKCRIRELDKTKRAKRKVIYKPLLVTGRELIRYINFRKETRLSLSAYLLKVGLCTILMDETKLNNILDVSEEMMAERAIKTKEKVGQATSNPLAIRLVPITDDSWLYEGDVQKG